MKIYLAAPYTLGDVAWNIHRVFKVADQLVEKGHIPIIPHLTHFWHLVSPKPVRFWYEYDLHLLKMCDGLLRLDGNSKGADNEVLVASGMGMPIYYSLEEVEDVS